MKGDHAEDGGGVVVLREEWRVASDGGAVVKQLSSYCGKNGEWPPMAVR